jgi:hypothetical protein
MSSAVFAVFALLILIAMNDVSRRLDRIARALEDRNAEEPHYD